MFNPASNPVDSLVGFLWLHPFLSIHPSLTSIFALLQILILAQQTLKIVS
jgi:hypothetical protein